MKAELTPNKSLQIGRFGTAIILELCMSKRNIKAFNDQFGYMDWKDGVKIPKVISVVPDKVAADAAYNNAIEDNDNKSA